MNNKKRFEVHIGMKEYVNIDCVREFVRSMRIILENHPDISYISIVEFNFDEDSNED